MIVSDRTSKLLRIGDLRKLILPSTSLTTVKLYMQLIESMQSQVAVTDIISQLERDEGLVLTTYTDTTGNLTIGYGHNLIANPISGIGPGSTITQAQAFNILANDITTTYQSLVQAAPWIALFNPSGGQVTRRGVLLNMAFNLGVSGLLTFKNMLAAVKTHDYATAATDMASSLWASQVGARATRLETQMTSDLWT